MNIAPSLLLFDPPAIDFTTDTVETLSFDLSAALTSLGAAAAINPTAVLVDVKTNQVIPETLSPIMASGTVVEVLLNGAALSVDRQYRLKIGFTPTGTTEVIVLWVMVSCLF
jgi:hypothetical protein